MNIMYSHFSLPLCGIENFCCHVASVHTSTHAQRIVNFPHTQNHVHIQEGRTAGLLLLTGSRDQKLQERVSQLYSAGEHRRQNEMIQSQSATVRHMDQDYLLLTPGNLTSSVLLRSTRMTSVYIFLLSL